MHGLACPRCQADLEKSAQGNLTCRPCGTTYPMLGSTPFLYPDPGRALQDWRCRFSRLTSEIQSRIDAIEQSSPGTQCGHERLAKLSQAYHGYLEELAGVLAPLRPGAPVAEEVHLALGSGHALDAYHGNIFRDWCWGQEENSLVLQHLTGMLETQPRRVLVLGSGAGRLAFDLHQHFCLAGGSQNDQQARTSNLTTIALDSNPLLSLVAGAMFQGQPLTLTEFPRAPVAADDVAVRHTLNSVAAEPGLVSVCADALATPFAPRSFDLVVTSWLLDVMESPLADMVNRVAQLLSEGGIWIYHGSVAFTSSDPAQMWSKEDLREIAEGQGFEISGSQDMRLPYLNSPHSRMHRSELVHTLLAVRKAQTVKQSTCAQADSPPWLQDTSLPIPRTEEFRLQLTTTRIRAFLMGLIDGKRSVRDIAKVLEQERLMPASEAFGAVRNFLSTMHDEAQARRRG